MALTKVQIDGVEFSDSTDLNVDNGTLVVDSSTNRVGVGTTSPSRPLTLQSDSSTAFAIQADSDTTLRLQMGYDHTNDYARIASEDVGSDQKDIFQHALNHRWGRNNSTEYMRIDASGRVGIGTSSPGALLNTRWTGTRAGSTGVHFATSHGDSSDYTLLKVSTSEGGTDAATKFLIRGDGNVGIGTTSPAADLHINAASGDVTGRWSSTGNTVVTHLAGTSDTAALMFGDSADADIGQIRYENSNDSMSFVVNNSTRATIDSSGRLLVGTSSSRSLSNHAKIQTETTSSYCISAVQNSNDDNGSIISFGKTRGTAVGGTTSVSSGDSLGILRYYGSDGTNMVRGAEISCLVDGTPGTNDMPGRLVFSTTADGASSPTERVRIFSNGRLACGRDSRDATFGTDEQFIINGNGYAAFHGLNASAYLIGQNSNSRDLRIGSGSGYASTGVQLAAGGTSWGTYSDERLKTDIVELADCLESIKDIRCVSYRLADIDEADSKKRLGVIAQDLVGKYDEAINSSKRQEEDDTEYLSVQYTDLIPVLLKALQEATTKIETLEAKVSALEAN